MYKRENLICQPITELRELGKLLGVKSPTTFDKETLITKILELNEKTLLTGYTFSDIKNIIIATPEEKCYDTIGMIHSEKDYFVLYDFNNNNTEIIMPKYVAEFFNIQKGDVIEARYCLVERNKFIKIVTKKLFSEFDEMKIMTERPNRSIFLIDKRVPGIIKHSNNNNVLLLAPSLFVEELNQLNKIKKIISTNYENAANVIEEYIDFVKAYIKKEYIENKSVLLILEIDGILDACERGKLNPMEKIISLYELARNGKQAKIEVIGITTDQIILEKIQRKLL